MCTFSPTPICQSLFEDILQHIFQFAPVFLLYPSNILSSLFLSTPSCRQEGNIYNESWIRQVKWMWALGDLENTSRRNAVLGTLKSSRFIEAFHINLWTLSIFHAVEWKNNTAAIFLRVVWENKNTRRWSRRKRSLLKSQFRILLRKYVYISVHVRGYIVVLGTVWFLVRISLHIFCTLTNQVRSGMKIQLFRNVTPCRLLQPEYEDNTHFQNLAEVY